MRLHIEPTILPPPTGGTALGIIRTAMPIDTLEIIAIPAELAGGHAGHIAQRLELVLGGFVVVIVRARVVGAVVAQEIHVAHLQLLDPFHFVRVVGYHGIDPLAEPVAWHLWGFLVVVGDRLGGRGWGDDGRLGFGGRGPGGCGGVETGGVAAGGGGGVGGVGGGAEGDGGLVGGVIARWWGR